MKKVCLTVLCILLVGCGNAETAETEEKMRFENLDPAKVNMQYGGLKEWDRFYNSFYEQKEGSDLIVLGTVEDYSCFAGGIEIATDISLRVDDVLKGDMEAGELVHVIADCHIYDRHIPVIKELISRTPYPAPTVKLNPDVKNFYDFTTDDLIVENYQTWPQIKNIPIAI